jgi:hypothetical protein
MVRKKFSSANPLFNLALLRDTTDTHDLAVNDYGRSRKNTQLGYLLKIRHLDHISFDSFGGNSSLYRFLCFLTGSTSGSTYLDFHLFPLLEIK